MPIPLAHYTFDDNWNVSGLVKEPYGFLGEPRGSVAPVAAPAAAPKADTCNAASFSGGTIEVSGLSVAPQAAAKTTVAFWMRWNGVDGAMPLSWATQGLLFSGGGFGFTTLNGDVFGVSSTGLANTWHYVVAEFTKGGVASNRLSIDKIPQALTQRAGTPILANAVVSGALRFGGQYGTTTNRFGGLIDEVWLFNSVLSPAYVNALYASASPCAPVSAIIVLPGSNAVYEAPATIDVVVVATSQNSVITQFDYYDGGVFIGTRQPGFGFSLANLPAGTHTFTVKATDATGAFATSSPVTATVAALAGASTVALATPAQGGTFYTSGTIHFGATATPAPSYNITRVEFYANGQEIGWSTTAPYDFTWTYPTAGTYTITAHVTDNAGLVTISAPITITVIAGAPAITYYYNDVAGTPIAATDQSGNLLWDETYAPYGARYSNEDTGTQNGLWYTGKATEDVTGLSYYGGRWYSPTMGRFFSVDPQRFDDNSPLSFNRYAYGNNNPYRFADPDGNFVVPIILLAAAAWTVYELSPYSMPQVAPNSGAVAPAPAPWELVGAIAGSVRAITSMAARVTARASTEAVEAATSGETKFTAAGRLAHDATPPPEGFEPNVRVPGTRMRMDGYNRDTKQVWELKPDNARAITRGEKQLDKYCRACDASELGSGHTSLPVQTYNPKDFLP
jgi:RHS repeat-associated protein